MINKITVKGFKSLQDIELGLGVVNVFVGANGSGKTNLLEAVGFLGAATDERLDDQALLRRGVRISPPSLYQSSFNKIDSEKSIVISAATASGGREFGYQLVLNKTDLQQQPLTYETDYIIDDKSVTIYKTYRAFDIMEPPPETLGLSQAELDKFYQDININLLSVLKDYGIFSANTSTLRGLSPDITQRIPVGLAGGQLARAVGELLSLNRNTFGALDLDDLLELLDWVDEITVGPPSSRLVSASVPTLREIIRFTDRWMSAANNELSAYDASEGALHVLFALTLALHPQSPRLFAIDNFDQTMHPRLARATVRLFCQQMLQANPTRQVLLTTHNPLVLDGLDLRDDRIRLFAVERNSKGATQIHRAQVSEKILQAAQDGLSLSNLWVMGRLGGVPDLF